MAGLPAQAIVDRFAEVEPELFLIPLTSTGGIVYSPLAHRACRVRTRQSLQPQIVRAGLTGPGVRLDSPFRAHPAVFSPTKVTLFPTNRCGQRCRYCYAQGGLTPTLDMPLGTATTAIDFVIRSTRALGLDEWVLAFHGGGEPLVRFDRLKAVVEYAEAQSARAGLTVRPISSTGGVISRECAEWVAAHFAHMVVSFEVLEDVQNAQRGDAAGRASFDRVHDVLTTLDAHDFPYFIRTTVTSANVDRLVETAEAIAVRYRSRLWHVEPMMLEGDRAASVQDMFPNMDDFARSYLEAHRRCLDLGIRLQYSGTMFEGLSSTFHCGVGNDNFAVTPDGCVTTCLDVLSKDHPRAARFVYGHVHEDGRVEIDDAKRQELHRLDVRNIPWCTGCFLKYHCSGDCVIRGGGDVFGNRDNDRCRTNRVIAAALLDRALEEPERADGRDIPLSTLY